MPTAQVKSNDPWPALRWARHRALLLADVLLVLATLIPRLLLARSLDLTTDEGVYIPIGQQDVLLLLHHDIFNAHWLDNSEAPALPKLFIGLGALVGQALGGQPGLLFGARLPAILLSTGGMILAFHLARPIIGSISALLGCLALALSPWLAYFAALAYLDTYMMIFLTLALLLTWHAARDPRWWPLVGGLLGLALVSKYTALAGIMPIAAYLGYRRLALRQRLSLRQLGYAVLAFGGAVLLADPAIWANPLSRLNNSIRFQFFHAQNGHHVFWFGQVWYHVVPGMGLAITLAKMSLFVTVPALAVIGWRMGMALRHRQWPDDTAAYLICWLVGLIVPFCGLTIIVGTHYLLPLAPPFAFTSAWGLVKFAQWFAPHLRQWFAQWHLTESVHWLRTLATEKHFQMGLLALGLLGIVLPPLLALVTIRQAEGYTSEWLRGENTTLQVAYPAYADALAWLAHHTQGNQTVALIALPHTLDYWLILHHGDFPPRFTLLIGTPDQVPVAAYVIWPEHLMQRQFPTPAQWQRHIVTTIQGGGTTYCTILRA
jgi:hypothetical protein